MEEALLGLAPPPTRQAWLEVVLVMVVLGLGGLGGLAGLAGGGGRAAGGGGALRCRRAEM